MKPGKLKQIALHNLTIAFVLALPFIIFQQIYVSKFTLKVTGPLDSPFYRYIFYNDLNRDGSSDQIYFGLNDLGNVYCKIFDPAHRGQFNTVGDFTDLYFTAFFADTDSDGYNEILFLTAKDSSQVVLNIVNYHSDTIKTFPVCEVGIPGKRDFYATIKDFIDLKGDGEKEVLITINAGFALQPRAVFTVNPNTGEIKRSPETGSKHTRTFLDDLDNDTFQELISTTFTYQNYDSTAGFPYDDNWSRLVVFDHELNFKFQPLQFSNSRSGATAVTFPIENNKFLLVLVDIQDNLTTPDQLILIASDGRIDKVKDIIVDSKYQSHDSQLVKSGNHVLLNNGSGIIYRVMPDLELEKITYRKKLVNNSLIQNDLNGDGNPELIWGNRLNGEITITDSKIKHPVNLSIPGNYPIWISPVVQQSQNNSWLVRNNTGHYQVTYMVNLFWKLRFLFWVLTYVFFWGLLLLTNKIQSYKIREKQRIQQQMQELQYRVITSRFSPHYTFNVLNSLSSQLYDHEKPGLYDYFNKFIRQLRYLYDDKNALTRSLKEELQFCRDYLDIQKMRFPEKFDYQVEVGEGVDTSIQVPKMILHIFVENAFKHGLRPYTSGGLITIDIKSDSPGDALAQSQGNTGKIVSPGHGTTTKTIITITDNGIGSKAAREYVRQNPQYSSGRGIEMLREFLELYNKDRKEKVEIEVEDLTSETHSGTSVRVDICF